jgi:hypothetical protein
VARVATKNTYGIEVVPGGIELQRLIVAGQTIPDHYQVDTGAYREVEDADVAKTAAQEASSSRVLGQVGGDDPTDTVSSGTPVEAAASVSPRNVGGSGSDGPTLEELQNRASELEIEGRSKMNKEELAQAVAKAEED